MVSQQQDDIQQLKLDVGLIKRDIQSLQKSVTTNQETIIEKMDKFAFVLQRDYDRDMVALNNRIDEVIAEQERQAKLVDAGGLKALNTLNSGVSKLILGALAFGLVALIVWSLLRVSPAIGGL